MSSQDNGATRDAIRNAGRYVLAALKRGSPSDAIAEAWYMTARGDVVYLKNDRVSAWAVALNKRHPAWGEWFSGPKVATNWAKPNRTDFDAKALDRAAEVAAEAFGDDWLRNFAARSDIWQET